MVTTSEDLLRMYHTAIPEKIKACCDNGGDVKIITNACDEKSMTIITGMGASEVRVGKLPSKSRMIVESKRQLIMSGSMKESMDLNDEMDSILYTNSTEMVDNMFSLCNHLWKKSKRAELVTSK